MTKHLLILGCIALSGLGLAFPGSAADADINNIHLIAIKSLQVRFEKTVTYLDITVVIANSNPQNLKLGPRNFMFFLTTFAQAIDQRQLTSWEAIKAIKQDTQHTRYLGSDTTRTETLLLAEPAGAKDTLEGLNEVSFYVRLDDEKLQETLAFLLNTLGNPSDHAPLLIIEGEKMEAWQADRVKGWSSLGVAGITWWLTPRVQPRYLFYHGSSR